MGSEVNARLSLPTEWNLKTLIDFSTKEKNSFVNGPFGSDLLSSELTDVGMPVIYIRDIQSNRYIRKSKVCVTYEKYQSLSACQLTYGDLIISKVGDPPCEAAVYTSDSNGIVTQDVIRIKTPKTFLSEYLGYLLNSDIGKREVKKIKIAGTRERVSLTDFKKIKLPYPPIIEQQKMAEILATWDEAITTTEAQIKNSEQQKKALMQQLLTGKKRLLDDNGERFSGEWEVKKLSEIYRFIPTTVLSRNQLNESRGEIKNIHYGDIHTKYKTLLNAKKDQIPYINSDVKLTKVKEGSFCKQGDIIFADASEDLNDIGKCIEVFHTNSSMILSGLHTLHARQRTPLLVIGFAGYLFTAPNIRRQIQRESQGAKVLGISMSRISNVKITYPAIKEEQQKIAEVLTAADTDIEALRGKLAHLQQEKKALMQQLLTGKRRVKV